MSGIPWLGANTFPDASIRRSFDIELGKMLQTVAGSVLDEETPYLNSASIQWSGVVEDPSKRMWASPAERIKFAVLSGDLLICEGGDVGRSAIYQGNGHPIIQNSVHRVRGTELGDVRFLRYVLMSLHGSEWLDVLCNKATIRHFTGDKLGSLRIPLPSLEEQRRIADFLDVETSHISSLETLTSRQVAQFEERLRANFREVTIGAQETPLKATIIPWMPSIGADWELRKVAHEFRTGSGTTPNSDIESYFDGEIPWVNSGDVQDCDIAATTKAISAAALRDYPMLEIHPAGSLVIAMYGAGATKGRVGMLRVPACVNQACCVLTPTGSVSAEYAQYWFRAHKDHVVAMATGAGQPNLSQEIIRNLSISAPSLEEQWRIVATLREEELGTRSVVKSLNRRRKLLAERRQALITAAVTGQLDVTTARSGVGA